MAVFTLFRLSEAPGVFLVVGTDGRPVSVINDFLGALAHRGQSSYTLRAYALGLVHFFTWLEQTGHHLDAVTRQTIETYISAFGDEPKGGACPADPSRAGQVNLLTRKALPSTQRKPRTINHRLSLLASFFAFHIQQDSEQNTGPWKGRTNPVPMSPLMPVGTHGMPGRDAPKRGKAGELRRRVSRQIPRQLDPVLVEQLIATATSWRDKAILTLLYRTGQRIGDWSPFAGRHGILGMTLTDVDERTRTVTVLLKGARDEHRVPVTDDFWPLLQQYLTCERQAAPEVNALWIAQRKGAGKPLSYAAFESSLRYVGRKLGANVNAHQFRHTLAQALVDLGKLKVAQEVLGHRHLSTTADSYASVDQRAMVEALGAVKAHLDAQPTKGPMTAPEQTGALPASHYVFAYDQITLEELEQAATQHPRTIG